MPLHESVSILSVIGEGSKRARMRASGLFRNPVTMATMIFAGVVMIVVGSASAAASAGASSPRAGWTIQSFAKPSSFNASQNASCGSGAAGELCDGYQVTVRDAGQGKTDGSPVTVSDEVPAGLTVRKLEFLWSGVVRLHFPTLTEGTDLNEAIPHEFGLPPLCTVVPNGGLPSPATVQC